MSCTAVIIKTGISGNLFLICSRKPIPSKGEFIRSLVTKSNLSPGIEQLYCLLTTSDITASIPAEAQHVSQNFTDGFLVIDQKNTFSRRGFPNSFSNHGKQLPRTKRCWNRRAIQPDIPWHEPFRSKSFR